MRQSLIQRFAELSLALAALLLSVSILHASAPAPLITPKWVEGRIRELAPSGSVVDRVQFNDKEVIVDGHSERTAQVSAFLRNLEGSDIFEGVWLTLINSTGEGKSLSTSFKLTLKLK